MAVFSSCGQPLPRWVGWWGEHWASWQEGTWVWIPIVTHQLRGLEQSFMFGGPVSSVKGDVQTKTPSSSGLLDASALLPTADSELTIHSLKGGGERAPICRRTGRLEMPGRAMKPDCSACGPPSQDGLCWWLAAALAPWDAQPGMGCSVDGHKILLSNAVSQW